MKLSTRDYAVRSNLAVPIGREGRAWGVLCAADTITHRFGVREWRAASCSAE